MVLRRLDPAPFGLEKHVRMMIKHPSLIIAALFAASCINYTGLEGDGRGYTKPIALGPVDSVDASVSTAGGTADASVANVHTIVIDGTNDFTAAETFATTTNGYTFYAAWDSTYVYFGASGSDVGATAAATKWWHLYLGNPAAATGATSGVTYATQQPALPVSVQWHVRWKTTNDYTNAMTWTAGAWAEGNVDFKTNVARGVVNNFVELRIARSTLGHPSSIFVVSSFVDENARTEITCAGVPSSTFADGLDPDFEKALALDLERSPSLATVVP
jgi:hypothetical protein